MIPIAQRLKSIAPSPTLAIDAKANALIKQGVDILKFGLGEPDFDTPDHIKEAAIKAIKDGFTKYTAVGGTPELKSAIMEKLKRENGIVCGPENIIACNGAKQALFNLFMALVNPGDEVLIPSPYWVSYADMILLCGGKPVTIDTTKNGFKVTANMVKKHLSPKTKILILNSPSNPTGAVLDHKEVEKIGELALERKLYLVSDEVYEHFIYDKAERFSVASLPGLKDLAITVNAVSKTYAMTGWRLGYAAGPKEIIQAMTNAQSHSTSNPCSISQKAAVAALTGPQDCVKEMRKEYEKRRLIVYDGFRAIPGVKLEKPEGAFYAFPDVSAYHKGAIKNSFDFADFLLEKAKVAVVPGGAFGKEGDPYIRFSYASSEKNIREGLRRIGETLRQISA